MFQCNVSVHSVTDIASIPNQAGLVGNWILSTTITQQDLTICAASHTVCVCMWPLDHEAYSLIVIQQARTSPWLFAGPQIIFASPKTTKTTQLLFGLSPGQVLTASTNTSQATQLVDCFCLLTLLPSLPGSPGWPGTPADPCGKDMHHSELGATFACIWHCKEKLWLVSCKKIKKRRKKEEDANRFVPHVLSRFAMTGNTALAELKMREQIEGRMYSCSFLSFLSREEFVGDFSTIPLIGNLQPRLIRASFHYSTSILS